MRKRRGERGSTNSRWMRKKEIFFLSSVSLSPPPSLFCAPEIKEEERGGEKEEG